MEKNELTHWGIVGQKWGVRRYQNEDGTYTEEGKLRKRKYSDDYERISKLRKKSYKELSNQELRDANDRARLENEYKNLNPDLIKKGAKIAKDITYVIGAGVGLYAVAKSGKKIADELIKAGAVALTVAKDVKKGLTIRV